jgi:hypothetical protein
MDSMELQNYTQPVGDDPVDRKSLRSWIKRNCSDALRQAEEEKDQIGFIISHTLLQDLVGMNSRNTPVSALSFVLGCCSVDDFQVSILPHTGDVMVNTWPQSPEGWEGFRVP